MKPRYRPRFAPAALCGALLVCLVSVPLLAPAESMRSSNPPPARTGAPGEGTCNTCHNGALNDGQETFTLSGVPAMYTPGQKYTLTVSFSRATAQRWGFQITSLFETGNAYAGLLAVTNSFTRYDVSGSRGYVSQTINTGADGTYEGTVGGPVTWTFDWTAPPAGGGTVHFYMIGVAADGGHNANSGDRVYTNHSVTSAEAPTTATADTEVTTWGWIKTHYR